MEVPKWIMNKDVLIMMKLQNRRNVFWNVFFKIFSCLANFGWFYFLSPLVLILHGKYKEAGYIAFLAAASTAIIINIGLKKIFRRKRPFEAVVQIVPITRKPKDPSFPSGHTAVAFACAFVFVFMLPIYISLPFVIIASLTSFARLYLGVHYPSDIIAGIITALVISYAVYQYHVPSFIIE